MKYSKNTKKTEKPFFSLALRLSGERVGVRGVYARSVNSVSIREICAIRGQKRPSLVSW
jgi:hypothetical protein